MQCRRQQLSISGTIEIRISLSHLGGIRAKYHWSYNLQTPDTVLLACEDTDTTDTFLLDSDILADGPPSLWECLLTGQDTICILLQIPSQVYLETFLKLFRFILVRLYWLMIHTEGRSPLEWVQWSSDVLTRLVFIVSSPGGWDLPGRGHPVSRTSQYVNISTPCLLPPLSCLLPLNSINLIKRQIDINQDKRPGKNPVHHH